MTHWALSPHVVGFVQALRTQGLQIGSGETQNALAALASIPLAQPDSFRWALRQTLAKSREDQAIFDRVFSQYWQPQIIEDAVTTDEAEEADELAQPAATPPDYGGHAAQPASAEPTRQQDDGLSSGASKQARLMQRDFIHVNTDEMTQMRDLIALIGKRLARQVGRRWRVGNRGIPDLRRSMRAALAQGGELWHIKYRRRRPQRLNLVVLADVSHSMDAYSRFFLQFIYTFQDLFRRMETFVFSTQLSQVTQALCRGSLDQALDDLPDAVSDWAGGTRIGASLSQFMREHGETMLGRNTVVMVVSDGWESDNPGALDAILRSLRQRCRQLIWLDPLLDHPRYFASAAGVHTDSRWIDHCLPARDLASLEKLAKALKS